MTPRCEFCGRRDVLGIGLLLRAGRQLRTQRRAIRELHEALIVAQDRAGHEVAARLDAEARCRRSEAVLDLLTRQRFDQIVKGTGEGGA